MKHKRRSKFLDDARHEQRLDEQEFFEEMQRRQRNILWRDTLRNAGIADRFMLKGSPKATKVQRIGMALFGFILVTLAPVVAYLLGPRSVIQAFVTVAVTLPLLHIGLRIFRNAFRH